MTRQLFRARRLVDGSGAAIDYGAVLIAGDTIEAVGRAVEVGEPDGVETIDLGDSTLLPGLIDVHNHTTLPGDMRIVQQIASHDTETMLAQGRATAADLLAAGITTVRDLGALGDVGFRLAREIADGRADGPEIIPSTAQLTSVGGPNAPLGGGCADLAGCVQRIDADAEQGARAVKIIATGSVTDTSSDPTQPVFDDATVVGIVEHAHRLGLRVAAHAHGSAGIAQAARCGVDSIEHASFLTRVDVTDAATPDAPSAAGLTSWPDADVMAVLRAHRPWVVLTLAASFAHSQVERVTPTSLRDFAHRLQVGRLLLEHGLPLVAGTDGGSPGVPHLSLVSEIEQLHGLGMTTMDALLGATAHAAACLGLSDRGLLRQGLRADLIAVPADPLRHLDVLRAPSLVVIGGRTVHRVQLQPIARNDDARTDGSPDRPLPTKEVSA